MRLAQSILTALLVVSMLFSGCSGASDEAKEKNEVKAPADSDGPGARVTGFVHDDAGLPVQGADVGLMGLETTEFDRTTATDSDGRFDLGKSPVGDWTLSVQVLGYEAYAQPLTIADAVDQELEIQLVRIEFTEPYYTTQIDRFVQSIGVAWQIGGDFNQGCIQPGVTCQAIAVAANLIFTVNETKENPVGGIVYEQTWVPNSAVCAKAAAVDIYSPEDEGGGPDLENPHYWTNYPSDVWSTRSPVVMVIPRFEAGNTNSIDDPARIEKNGGDRIDPDGDWLVRNFPPGKGLTNLPVDANCFMDQQMDAFFTAFFGMPPIADFAARDTQ